MTDTEAAREAWEKAWLQSQSLHMYSVVEKAREYISALEAENERLRCCGNCVSWNWSGMDDGNVCDHDENYTGSNRDRGG